MKTHILILTILLLAGCRADTVDISNLNPPDRVLFTIAADMEGFDVTLNGDIDDLTVQYNLTMPFHGYAITEGGICYISINTRNINNDPCEIGGTNQRFITTSRHELRHCQGAGHSDDPQKLMYDSPQCWPVD